MHYFNGNNTKTTFYTRGPVLQTLVTNLIGTILKLYSTLRGPVLQTLKLATCLQFILNNYLLENKYDNLLVISSNFQIGLLRHHGCRF